MSDIDEQEALVATKVKVKVYRIGPGGRFPECQDDTCSARQDCANHATAGDFRIEDGLTPDLSKRDGTGDWECSQRPSGRGARLVIDVWSKQGTIVYATPAANKPKENNRPCEMCLRVVTYLKCGEPTGDGLRKYEEVLTHWPADNLEIRVERSKNARTWVIDSHPKSKGELHEKLKVIHGLREETEYTLVF